MQNKKIKILPATAEDLEPIVEIETHSRLNQWGAESYKSELGKKDKLFFVAKDEHKIVGFIFASLITPTIEIFNIAVSPNYKRQGIGQKLFETILECAVKEGCRECWLEVRETNQTARQFYEKLKFKLVGRRKKYYQNPAEDALLLEYKITGEP